MLSPQEAGERLGVSVYTVRRWIKEGKLRAFRPGKEYRVREADLEEFFRAREVHPKVEKSPDESAEWGFHQARGLVLEAARKEARREEQMVNRLFESDLPQSKFSPDLMEAGQRLQDEFSPADIAVALRELALWYARLERDNANLQKPSHKRGVRSTTASRRRLKRHEDEKRPEPQQPRPDL